MVLAPGQPCGTGLSRGGVFWFWMFVVKPQVAMEALPMMDPFRVVAISGLMLLALALSPEPSVQAVVATLIKYPTQDSSVSVERAAEARPASVQNAVSSLKP